MGEYVKATAKLDIAEYEFSCALRAMLEVTRKGHLRRLPKSSIKWLKQQIEEMEEEDGNTIREIDRAESARG